MRSGTTGNSREISPYVLPFVVAVTGHRDLHPDDLESVKSQIQDLIDIVLTTLPHTPIHFVSPLADGADQLFAEQILMKKKRLLCDNSQEGDRIKLIVPLPMTIDAYCHEQTNEVIAFGLDAPVLTLSQSTFTSRFNSLSSTNSSFNIFWVE